MNTGSWDIAVQIGKLPQKVATAFDSLNIVGAEYELIAYIGNQVVNGTNHAVLAKQTILNGKDTENVVVMIFNEKPNDMNAILVSIDRVLESGEPFGGIHVDVTTELDDEVMDIWNDAFEGFVGSTVTPYALLGTQITTGTEYAMIVTINPMTKKVEMGDMLTSKHEASLGYAFSW